MSLSARGDDGLASAFRHEAFPYSGEREFTSFALGFVRDSLAAGEPILVAVDGAKIDLLQSALGADSTCVSFADMALIGHNPARIIPTWNDFVVGHGRSGRRVRGIGEPIGPGRRGAELVECQLHEHLLNVAFDGSIPLWLVCPYDREELSEPVLREMERSHPFVGDGSSGRRSPRYRVPDANWPLRGRLPVPPAAAVEWTFDANGLATLRAEVIESGRRAGLSEEKSVDLALAVNELAVNSVRHGEGPRCISSWIDDGVVMFQVADHGRIRDALVGRRRPSSHHKFGRGLWIANQLCDLVQIRSSPEGTVVRLHMDL